MTSEAESPIIVKGRVFDVEYAVLNDRTSPAREYMESLADADRLSVIAYIQHLADNGFISNKPNKFKRVKEPFCAFKRKGENGRRIRIVCFQEKKRWILTHGFDKPAQKKWPEREFTRATMIRNEQLEREKKSKGDKNA